MIETKDVLAIKEDFPILKQKVHSNPLVYLDNAATSQKPKSVIEAIDEYYRTYNANVHRGVYYLSEEATARFEEARAKIAELINARSTQELIFVRNTTEAINLVAYSWGRANIGPGDTIVLTEMEHHSNLVPWQLLAKEKGAKLEFIRIDDEGRLILEDLDRYLNERVKLVAVTHVSNALGTINPVKEIVAKAHQVGALALIDGAQSVPHRPVDVQEMDCDFLAFSGHKMMGPMGIGVLYGRREILEEMNPFLGGGDMIRTVKLREATWNALPWKFEAGTPNVVGGIGLGKAVDYLRDIGMEIVAQHEKDLAKYALEALKDLKGITIYGPSLAFRGGVVSFNLEGVHPHDIATILDLEGLAIRAGHHCCQPLMARLNVAATARASFYIYNRSEDVDALVAGLHKVQKIFGL